MAQASPRHSISAKPELSVVMAVRDGAQTLEATLQSILNQSGCTFEVIVVNDGSTDATGALLDSAAANDARLVVLHQANTGLTGALRAGCELARGEFIARNDAGDLSLPGRFAKQLTAFRQHADLVFVSCATRYVEPAGAILFQQQGTGFARQPQNIIDPQQQHCIADGPSHHGAVMFRADAYRRAGGYRAEFYFGQDWDLWYRLAEQGHFQMLEDVLYQATIGVGDISTSNKPQQEQLARLSLRAARLRNEGKSDTEVLALAAGIRPASGGRSRGQRIASGSYFLGECLRVNGNPRRAREYFVQVLRHQPWNVKAWIRFAQTAVAPVN
jgi:glycosyltransferase involved in cell wall biosynthesis